MSKRHKSGPDFETVFNPSVRAQFTTPPQPFRSDDELYLPNRPAYNLHKEIILQLSKHNEDKVFRAIDELRDMRVKVDLNFVSEENDALIDAILSTRWADSTWFINGIFGDMGKDGFKAPLDLSKKDKNGFPLICRVVIMDEPKKVFVAMDAVLRYLSSKSALRVFNLNVKTSNGVDATQMASHFYYKQMLANLSVQNHLLTEPYAYNTDTVIGTSTNTEASSSNDV